MATEDPSQPPLKKKRTVHMKKPEEDRPERLRQSEKMKTARRY